MQVRTARSPGPTRPSRPAAAPAPAARPSASGGLAAAVLALTDALCEARLRAGRALFGVGVTEMAALEALAGGERTPTEIAEHLHLTTASVTGLVDRLAAEGHVDRRPHPSDRRKVLVALTAQAQDRLADWHAQVAATAQRATSGLSADQQAALVEHLTGLAAAYATAAPADRTADQAEDRTADRTVDRTALTEALERITAATDAFTRPGRRP